MPPLSGSRHGFCLGVLDPQGRLFLTEREPYRYRAFADNRVHRVVEGETLFDLAGRYFAPLPRACGFWWAIADFQQQPMVDPTLALEEGATVVIPSTRVLTDVILADLSAHRVTYRGHEIPTRPPNNLQHQPLLALAVLASRPGEVVTMAELAEGMHKLGGLRKRPVAPEAKDLRYKSLRPIKKALDGVVPGTELDELVETVQGVGMRVTHTSRLAACG